MLLFLGLLGAVVIWNLNLTTRIGRLQKSVDALTGGQPAPPPRRLRRRMAGPPGRRAPPGKPQAPADPPAPESGSERETPPDPPPEA